MSTTHCRKLLRVAVYANYVHNGLPYTLGAIDVRLGRAGRSVGETVGAIASLRRVMRWGQPCHRRRGGRGYTSGAQTRPPPRPNPASDKWPAKSNKKN